MASGVIVKQECKEEFNNIKLKHCYKYVIFKLDKKMENIEVDKTAPKDATFSELRDELHLAEQAGECRYCVYDYAFSGADGQREKLVFIFWSPDGSKIKQKMVYAASKDALLKSFVDGIAKVMHISDLTELCEDTIREELGLSKN